MPPLTLALPSHTDAHDRSIHSLTTSSGACGSSIHRINQHHCCFKETLPKITKNSQKQFKWSWRRRWCWSENENFVNDFSSGGPLLENVKSEIWDLVCIFKMFPFPPPPNPTTTNEKEAIYLLMSCDQIWPGHRRPTTNGTNVADGSKKKS